MVAVVKARTGDFRRTLHVHALVPEGECMIARGWEGPMPLFSARVQNHTSGIKYDRHDVQKGVTTDKWT